MTTDRYELRAICEAFDDALCDVEVIRFALPSYIDYLRIQAASLNDQANKMQDLLNTLIATDDTNGARDRLDELADKAERREPVIIEQ